MKKFKEHIKKEAINNAALVEKLRQHPDLTCHAGLGYIFRTTDSSFQAITECLYSRLLTLSLDRYPFTRGIDIFHFFNKRLTRFPVYEEEIVKHVFPTLLKVNVTTLKLITDADVEYLSELLDNRDVSAGAALASYFNYMGAMYIYQ